MNYCKLWQAIISADLEGIKACSEKMDVGEYYGIFACMLAARTWETVVSGMKRTPFSQNEVSVIIAESRVRNVLKESNSCVHVGKSYERDWFEGVSVWRFKKLNL